jgi:hypothetical protein
MISDGCLAGPLTYSLIETRYIKEPLMTKEKTNRPTFVARLADVVEGIIDKRYPKTVA